MIKSVITLLTSGSVKASATTIGAGSLLALVLNLHAGVSERIEINQKKLHDVEVKIAPIPVELRNQTNAIKETKVLVRDIHNYLLNRKENGQ